MDLIYIAVSWEIKALYIDPTGGGKLRVSPRLPWGRLTASDRQPNIRFHSLEAMRVEFLAQGHNGTQLD